MGASDDPIVAVTYFPTLFATELKEIQLPWSEFVNRLRAPIVAPTKAALPLIKLATFRDRRLTYEMWEAGRKTPRFSDNLAECYGVEGDYDAGVLPCADAAALLESAGVRAVVVATPSARAGTHRWRVFAPLAVHCPAGERAWFLSLLDAVLGRVLSSESWRPAQAYYIGRTPDTVYEIYETRGRCLDECGEMPYLYEVDAPAGSVAPSGLTRAAEGYPMSDQEAANVRTALAGISSDDRNLWVRFGLVLKPYGAVGWALWDEWSKKSKKYSLDDSIYRWGTFMAEGKIGLGTIYYHADRAQAVLLASAPTLQAASGDGAPALGCLGTFLRSGKRVTGALDNAILAIQKAHKAGDIRYDSFKQCIRVHGAPLNDSIVSTLRRVVERSTEGRAWNKGDINTAIEAIAMTDQYNPLADYLRSLQWDGAARVDSFIARAFGLQQSKYTRTLGWCFLGSAVRRALYPGCVAQQSLLLIGGQGLKKSTFAKFLFGEDNVLEDLPSDIGTKDAAMALSGKWVVQLSEMDKASRVTRSALKSWLTRQTDTFRRPWQTHPEEHKRMFIVIGDCNEPDVLDDVENRRWLPIHVAGHIDLAWISENRDQLFAEVVAAIKANPHWLQPYLTESEYPELATARDRATAEDVWDRVIIDWVEAQGPERTFTTLDVVRQALYLPLDRCTVPVGKRISAILRKHGCQVANAPAGSISQRVWRLGTSPLRQN